MVKYIGKNFGMVFLPLLSAKIVQSTNAERCKRSGAAAAKRHFVAVVCATKGENYGIEVL